MSKFWHKGIGAAAVGSLILALSPTAALALPSGLQGAQSVFVQGSMGASGSNADEVITPNPAYQGEPFQGWGNSLVWFANATGNYPDDLKNELFDMVFGSDGLNLNVARYNIGGGNSSDTVNYLRPGADVPGWWKDEIPAADGSTVSSDYADRTAYLQNWNPTDESDFDTYFDDSKDAGQLWWVDRIAQTRDDAVFEAFSNSPPYFQTESGFTSGDWSDSTKQAADGAGDHALAATNDAPAKFAKYLAMVTDHIEKTHPGVTFQSVEPFNESTEGYWHTPDANPPTTWPAKGRIQEGGTIAPGPGLNDQQNVITELRAALDATDTDAVVSATDANWPSRMIENWGTYSSTVRDKVGQLNVHTYGETGSIAANALAKVNDRDLWMSEVGLDGVGSGFNPVSIAGGLSIASKINTGLRELQPEAYVQWQEVEDYYNMEKDEKLNWGSVFIDLDCSYFDAAGKPLQNEAGAIGFKSIRRVDAAGAANVATVPDCSIMTNSKYDVIRNYTHYINPGDRMIQTTSSNATAALDGNGDGGLSVVYSNSATTAKTVTLDLSKFASITPGSTVTPVVTTQAADNDDTSTALVAGTPVTVDSATKSATLTLPARSVTTLEVAAGLNGVATNAYAFQDGLSYQLASSGGTALTEGTNAVTASPSGTTPAGVANQLFTLHRIAGAATANDQTFAIEAPSGKFLTADSDGTLELTTSTLPDAGANVQATWYLHTTNGKTWDLLNKAAGRVLSVSGAAVSTAAASGDATQQFTVNSTTPTGSVEQIVATPVGVVPTNLPAQATPTYPWGTGIAADVTWDTAPLDSGVADAGTITLVGTATDVFGNDFTAQARVIVGSYSAIDAQSLTAVTGTPLNTVKALAPATVSARIGDNEERFPTPVTWDWSALSDSSLAQVGTLVVPGTAESNDPSNSDGVPAELAIKVYAVGTTGNLLAAENTSNRLVISHTEPGHETDYANGRLLRDGDTIGKAWTNWSNQAPTVTMDAKFNSAPDVPQLAAVTGFTFYFYRDSSTSTWPATYTLQYLAEDGATWIDVPGYANPVPLPGAEGTTAPTLTVDFEAPIVTAGFRASLHDSVSGTYMAGSEFQVRGAVVAAQPAPPVVKSALQAVVDAAGSLDSEEYTTTWWAALQEAVTAANAALGDSTATQTQVDALTTALQTVLDDPTLRGDAANLAAGVASADEFRSTLNESAYTEASVTALDDALAAAHASLVAKDDQTQAQLDAALTTLQGASAGLELRAAEDPSTEPGIGPDSGDNAPADQGSAPTAPSDGSLAITGASIVGLSLLAAILLGTGVAFTITRRRRDATTHVR